MSARRGLALRRPLQAAGEAGVPTSRLRRPGAMPGRLLRRATPPMPPSRALPARPRRRGP